MIPIERKRLVEVSGILQRKVVRELPYRGRVMALDMKRAVLIRKLGGTAIRSPYVGGRFFN